MSTLTSGKCIAAFITALQNNTGVTNLLGDGRNGIGSGAVTANTNYPYILIDHVTSRTNYAMGTVEIETNSMMRLNIFADDKSSKPAQQAISEISEAVAAALSTKGAVTITGRKVSTPTFDQITANKTQAFGETKVISWENQVWNMFSSPA